MQAHVDQTTGRNVLVGLSVVDSIKQCIRLKNQKAADDFKRSFGVSEKYESPRSLSEFEIDISGGSKFKRWPKSVIGMRSKSLRIPRNPLSVGNLLSKPA